VPLGIGALSRDSLSGSLNGADWRKIFLENEIEKVPTAQEETIIKRRNRIFSGGLLFVRIIVRSTSINAVSIHQKRISIAGIRANEIARLPNSFIREPPWNWVVMWYARNAHLITIPIVYLEIADLVLFTEGKGEYEQTGMCLRFNKAQFQLLLITPAGWSTLRTVVRCGDSIHTIAINHTSGSQRISDAWKWIIRVLPCTVYNHCYFARGNPACVWSTWACYLG